MGKVFLSQIKELLRLRLIIEKEMGIQKRVRLWTFGKAWLIFSLEYVDAAGGIELCPNSSFPASSVVKPFDPTTVRFTQMMVVVVVGSLIIAFMLSLTFQ